MPTLTYQNPDCGKEFEGRVQKDYESKFCSNDCSAKHRKLFPEEYNKKALGFQKGHVSWNKGKRLVSIGHTNIKKRTTQSGTYYLRFVIVEDENGELVYQRNDKIVWEKANGPMPEGHAIFHTDGDRLNDNLENLECVPLGEALRRYSLLKERPEIGHMKVLTRTNENGKKVKHNYINIGTEDGFTNYVRYDRYIWEQAHGPIKKRYVMYHKDRDTLNDSITNLECISMSKAKLRDAYYRRKELIGKTTIWRKKTGASGYKQYRYINVGNANKVRYIRHDKYVWFTEKGNIPEGHIIFHKDGRTLNDNINNLECLPFDEAMRKYAIINKKHFNLTSKKDIERIIEGCEKGNRKIQKQLYEMTYGKMMGTAMRYVRNNAVAKDILSDAYVKVFSKIKTVDVNKKNLEGWIRSVVVFTALDHIRKYKDKENITDSIDDEDVFIQVQDESAEMELGRTDGAYIIEMIQELPPAYRTAFNLNVIEGKKHKEVAEILGINEGTSKSNVFKAKQILKDKINKLNDEEENRVLIAEKNEELGFEFA